MFGVASLLATGRMEEEGCVMMEEDGFVIQNLPYGSDRHKIANIIKYRIAQKKLRTLGVVHSLRALLRLIRFRHCTSPALRRDKKQNLTRKVLTGSHKNGCQVKI